MTSFRAPLEDILFTLHHLSGAEALPGWDADLATEVVTQFARFAQSRLAPLDPTGDREGCRLVSGRVRMPAGFPAAYADLAADGWQGLSLPESAGGMGLPAILQGCVTEVFAGANHALQMVTGLVPGAATTLLRYGTRAQQDAWLPRLASGEVLSTMCLTEAGAGSDLATIACRAAPDGDGWRISGEKLFISGGDQDLTSDILHLVLARSGGPGVKGLSLFLCPSRRADGGANGVSVLRIEEKLGLHASPTCQMLFHNAEAQLIGAEGAGLEAMFTQMDHARLDVALQGVAHAARAADLARSYAATRLQGRDAKGQAVVLAAHDDVARMIDEADALALGHRVLCQSALTAMHTHGRDLSAALTPVCKWACTEAGIRAADLAIQVLGGYGYLEEYGCTQNWRDARVCAIYEGANGIHARNLADRLATHRDGAALDALADWIGPHAPPDWLSAWQTARRRLLALPNRPAAATPFMALTAEMLLQAAWRRIVAVADRHPEPARLHRLAAAMERRGTFMLPYLSSAAVG